MNAPFHRFDLLINLTPSALPAILQTFADCAVTPSSVVTRKHMHSLQSVTIILQELADKDTRAIEKRLRQNDLVRAVHLEHMMT